MSAELDDATRELVAEARRSGAPPLHRLSVSAARAADKVLPARYGPGPEVAGVRETRVRADDGGTFRVRVLTPPRPRAVLVYLHGGGWVVGDIDQFDHLGRRLALATRSTVVLVEYRKAPEHPYPAAVRDCWAALLWAAEHRQALAHDAAAPLLVAGDSAGGNLAAVTALRARDRSGPALALQVLIYPVVDHDFTTASHLDPDNQLLLTTPDMRWFWDHYADPARRAEPEASPLRAPTLAGVAPAVVLLAGRDVLRSEGRAYADALAAAGVPVRLREFPDQIHGFFSQVNVLPGSATALTWLTGVIDAHLGGPPGRP